MFTKRFFFVTRKLCLRSYISVVCDLLLGCYVFPFFKESFGDRNILLGKLYLCSVGCVAWLIFSPFSRRVLQIEIFCL